MNGSIYLIGGGEIRKGETTEIDNELKEIAVPNAAFVFFATAAGDNPDYINSIKSVFENSFTIIAPIEKDGREVALAAIETASVIYLGGGTTELLLDLFEKWKLVEPLRCALDRGAHVAGMSAGAQALSAWYIHEDRDSVELRRGWGFLPVCVLVHAHQDSFARAKLLWEDNQEACATAFIAIGEGASWHVNSLRAQKIGGGELWM